LFVLSHYVIEECETWNFGVEELCKTSIFYLKEKGKLKVWS